MCLLAAGVVVFVLLAAARGIADAAPPGRGATTPIVVEVATLDGRTVRGPLAAAFPELVLDVPEREVSLAWAEVLRVRVVGHRIRPPETPPAPWRVELADGSRFFAALDDRAGSAAADAGLRVRLAGRGAVVISPEHVRAIARTAPTTAAAARIREMFAGDTPRQDAVVLERGGRVMVLRGAAERIDTGAVRFAWKGRTLRLPWDRIAGLRVADVVAESAACRVRRRDGTVFAGEVVGGDAATLRLRNATLGTLDLPWAEIARIDCRSAYATYLSELVPVGYECTPLFSKRWPWAADKTLTGGPIRLGGQTVERGIVMHSRSVLVYALDGRYQRFVALAGILDETGGRGDVTLAVVGDGRTLWRAEHVRGGAAPRPVSVDVTGVRVLKLVVDFGDDLDLSDHAAWAQARLIGPAGE